MIKEIRTVPKKTTLALRIEGRLEEFVLEYPVVWRHLVEHEPLMTAFAHPDGRRVVASVKEEADGHRWLHVSVSRRDRLPSYQDLADVKAAFIGEDRDALQLFPRRAAHVNHMPTTLHLWCCLDARPLPDFRTPDGLV